MLFYHITYPEHLQGIWGQIPRHLSLVYPDKATGLEGYTRLRWRGICHSIPQNALDEVFIPDHVIIYILKNAINKV